MLRIFDASVELMNKLSDEERGELLNACLAAAAQRLSEGAKTISVRLGPGWFVYEGGHHLAIGKKKGEKWSPCIKLLDVADPGLCMNGFPASLCEERRLLGLSLNGVR